MKKLLILMESPTTLERATAIKDQLQSVAGMPVIVLGGVRQALIIETDEE